MGYTVDWWVSLSYNKEDEKKIQKIMKDQIFEDYGIVICPQISPRKNEISIDHDDTFGKYYENEWIKISNLLSGLVYGTIEFKGEDGDLWRFKFSSKGWEEQWGQIIYGDIIDEFERAYAESMSNELKNEILKLKIAEKI